MHQNNTILKIKQYLKQKGWTTYRLAKESNMAYSSLNNIFLRNTEPTIPTLRKLCTGLGISVSDFFQDDIVAKEDYSFDERQLIVLFREMKRADKRLLMAYAHGLAKVVPATSQEAANQANHQTKEETVATEKA